MIKNYLCNALIKNEILYIDYYIYYNSCTYSFGTKITLALKNAVFHYLNFSLYVPILQILCKCKWLYFFLGNWVFCNSALFDYLHNAICIMQYCICQKPSILWLSLFWYMVMTLVCASRFWRIARTLFLT